MNDLAAENILELRGISKHYAGIKALDEVDFSCAAGSIHAVLGENGAGKSTLIKIISGVVKPDSGSVRFAGETVVFKNPWQANEAGVVCIFQELSLLPDLSVADNICIAEKGTKFGLVDRKRQARRTEELLAMVGCEDLNPLQWVGSLPLSRRQLIEIAKALGKQPKLLILDEATSALTHKDVDLVYDILGRLRDNGVSMLYISHRMHEVDRLADVCSVFRNGRHVETFNKNEKNENEIVQLMIGRDIKNVFPVKPERAAPPRRLLEVSRLCWQEKLFDISFSVGRGEVLGIGGLDGQGQKELLLALFGVLRGVSGEITIDDQRVDLKSPGQAKSLSNNIALIPEDRKSEGLLLPMSITENISITSLDQFTRGLFIDGNSEREKTDEQANRLGIKIGDRKAAVSTLSGGNQQKVVIAKWLLTNAKIILLNDPTRGIDVGTKQEIYQLLRELSEQGACIIFYTTDYDELVGCCDRVLIFYQGRIVNELAGDGINETNIVTSSFDIAPADSAAANSVSGQPGQRFKRADE